MNWQKIQQAALSLLHLSLKTSHNRIVAAGLLVVGLGYLSFQIGEMLLKSLKGQAAVLMLAVLGFGIYILWSQRQQLSRRIASEEDRFIGHALVLCGIGLFPFNFSSIWSQALLCLLILAGVACSTWGLSVFKAHPLPISLIVLSLIPNPGIVARTFWATFVPPLMLERLTAWLGLLGLQAIGQPAELTGPDSTYIKLLNASSEAKGAVEVAWGCTGFNMGMSVAIMGLLMGLFFKQNWKKVMFLMLAGIVLALILNVPRMVLLAIAQVYWDKKWYGFAFWHDGWGAQLFSAFLFTVYYYIAMPFLSQKPLKSTS